MDQQNARNKKTEENNNKSDESADSLKDKPMLDDLKNHDFTIDSSRPDDPNTRDATSQNADQSQLDNIIAGDEEDLGKTKSDPRREFFSSLGVPNPDDDWYLQEQAGNPNRPLIRLFLLEQLSEAESHEVGLKTLMYSSWALAANEITGELFREGLYPPFSSRNCHE